MKEKYEMLLTDIPWRPSLDKGMWGGIFEEVWHWAEIGVENRGLSGNNEGKEGSR